MLYSITILPISFIPRSRYAFSPHGAVAVGLIPLRYYAASSPMQSV